MTIADFSEITWLLPRFPASPGLEDELYREVGPKHPLYNRTSISVGRRNDCDDALLFLPGGPQPLAVVHLTWTGRRAARPDWPSTELYLSLEDWIERSMKSDHQEFNRQFEDN